MYIPDKETLLKYVSINNDFPVDKFQAYVPIAMNKYFLTWMSQALIDQVFAWIAEPVNTPKRQGYELFIGSLARFAMLEYLSTGEVQIGAGGVTRTENTNTKSAFSGQMKSLKEGLEDNAYMEVNLQVDLMNANTGIFTEWAASPGSLKNTTLLIKSAKEFNECQKLHRGFSTFIHLVPDMETQQDLLLSSAFESTILTTLIGNAALAGNVLAVRKFAVKALVQFTIARALETGLVKLSGSGVQVIEENENTGHTIMKQANLTASAATIRKFEDTGHRYINKCQEIMEEFPTDFATQPVAETNTKPSHIFRA